MTEKLLSDLALAVLQEAIDKVEHCERYGPCKWERTVPFPVMQKNRDKDKFKHYVYKIEYKRRSQTKYSFWKFGLGREGTSRMAASVRDCYKKNSERVFNCRGVPLRRNENWSSARTLEGALVLDYALKHGKCPPGQRTSCE